MIKEKMHEIREDVKTVHGLKGEQEITPGVSATELNSLLADFSADLIGERTERIIKDKSIRKHYSRTMYDGFEM